MGIRRAFAGLIAASLLLASCSSDCRRAPIREVWRDTDVKIPVGSLQDLMKLSDSAVGAGGQIRSSGAGRLFLPNEVLATIIRTPRYKENLSVFSAAQKELARYGMEYLVVLVPGSSVVYPDALYPDHPMSEDGLPHRIDLHRLELFREFTEAGINYIDLTPPFIRARLGKNVDSRLRANSHWSCVGRVIAAQAVSDWIKARPWASSLRPVSKRFSASWSKSRISEVEPSMVEFMAINNLTDQDIAQTVYRRTVSGWSNGGKGSLIQVTGDSHLVAGDDESESFAAQLAYELQSEVSGVGVFGNWVFNGLANEYRSRPSDFMKRRVVVHVVSTRSFALFKQKYYPIFPGSVDPDELKAMPDKTSSMAPVVVEATCSKLSRTRDLASLKPYDSSLTCALFSVDRVVAGDYEGRDIAVAGWNIINKEDTTWQHLIVSNRSYRFELDPISMHPYLKKVAKDFDALEENMDAGIFWCREFYPLEMPEGADRNFFVITTDPQVMARAIKYGRQDSAP